MKIKFLLNVRVRDVPFKRGQTARVPGDVDAEACEELFRLKLVEQVEDTKPKVVKQA